MFNIFVSEKCKVLHLGGKSLLQWYRLGTDWLGAALLEQTWGVVADSKPSISQRHALAVRRASWAAFG